LPRVTGRWQRRSQVDDKNHEQRPRASLRGKGREILLGQHGLPDEAETPPPEPSAPDRVPKGPVDASSLALTPEETEALLDFSPVSPAYETALPLPTSQTVPARAEPPAPEAEDSSADWWGEPSPVVEESLTSDDEPAWWAEYDDESVAPIEASAEETDDAGYAARESIPMVTPPVDPDEGIHGALPLAERRLEMIIAGDDLPYEVAPQVDKLAPAKPEGWAEALAKTPAATRPPELLGRLKRYRQQAAEVDEGGLGVPDEDVDSSAAPVVADPFAAPPPRQTSEQLFPKTGRVDRDLLNMLVDDDKILKLARQIEAMQEELAQNVSSDPTTSDEYQQELLRASGLLMASRSNYDDARAIVYRVRTDMNRRRKIEWDIRRYRPLLLDYYVGWGVALVVLFLLKELFAGVTEAVGVEVFAALYYPMLFGIVGAMISGYLTLERHTTRLRDFDPIHISWYLFNPLLGGVMGLLMFLLVSVANEDLLQQSASEPERAVAYLVCVGAGMYQNNVLRQLGDLLDRFGRGSKK
jgi:hypothetical protein